MRVCIPFLFLIECVQNFNFDTNNPIVYVDPKLSENDTFPSYFGYTVVLYPGNRKNPEKWIKIGAPRGIDPTMNKFENTGVVYNCPMMSICKPVYIKTSNNYGENLTNAWIGGAMDISFKYERMSICAFRRVDMTEKSDYRTVGACFLSDLNNNYEKVVPLQGNAVYENKVYYYGQGQAGFSTHFASDEDVLSLGAPGVYNWAGTLIELKYEDVQDPVASRLSRGKRDIQRVMHVANAIYSKVSSAYDLFGYAVTSGYFYGRRKLYFAASTPKSTDYQGKVVDIVGWKLILTSAITGSIVILKIWNIQKKNVIKVGREKKDVVIAQFNENNPLIKKESRIGSQFGEYFGACLAAGDVNNDGCDDLFVGAPFHAKDSYNDGAVYIFLGNLRGHLTENGRLWGQSTRGQFGSAVMFLGDINKDGYGDIAVGAPYEDSSGVLYIYKGCSKGVEQKYSQRIVGKDISSEIRGFGISISRPADIDANGYEDIVVGAHKSGNAVLLRSRPVIAIVYQMKSSPKELKSDSKTFSLQICYRYTVFNETSIDISRTVTVDKDLARASINNKIESTKTLKIYRNSEICEQLTISLKNTTNYVSPITVSLTYELASQIPPKEVKYIADRIQGNDRFCDKCPILDEYRSSGPSTINVPFSLGCGADNVCQARLSIEADIPGQGNTFIVGSLEYVQLKTTVKNTGEHAYFTQLEINLPDGIFFRQVPSWCYEQNVSTIICNIDNPLRQNSEKSRELDLDMKNVKNNFGNELEISLRVMTTSKNSNISRKIFKLKLDRMADITIYGKPAEQSVPFGNMSFGMPNFTQIYQVEKLGVSPLEKVLVNITIPHAIRTASGDQKNFLSVYQPDAFFSGQPVTCTSNFSYVLELKSAMATEKLVVDDTEKKRRRRQVNGVEKSTSEELKIGNKEFVIVPNRTLFINCSTKDVVCSSILCSFGPFEKHQNPAFIKIKMMFDAQAISGIVGSKDMIVYSTHGSVSIESPSGFVQSGNKPDETDVSSLLINEVEKKVALWIIIVSIIVGLLLLYLIIYGLTKAGFFKRAKKEELKNLKAAAEQETANDEDVITEDPFESPTVNSSNEGLVDEAEGGK